VWELEVASLHTLISRHDYSTVLHKDVMTINIQGVNKYILQRSVVNRWVQSEVRGKGILLHISEALMRKQSVSGHACIKNI
jgi:hypothetical protein